jgi:hypothetical protein
MALTSQIQRTSLMSMGRPWVPRIGRPDGLWSAADRRTLIFRYSGSSTVVVVIGNARATSTARAHPRAVLVTDE